MALLYSKGEMEAIAEMRRRKRSQSLLRSYPSELVGHRIQESSEWKESSELRESSIVAPDHNGPWSSESNY